DEHRYLYRFEQHSKTENPELYYWKYLSKKKKLRFSNLFPPSILNPQSSCFKLLSS
ncbi:unnamed protein product, partial [Brassica napus]